MAPFTPSGDNYSDTGGMEKPLEYWHRFRYIKDEDLNRINGNRTGLTQSRKAAKKTYSLFATRGMPFFIRESLRLMRSPGPIIHGFSLCELCGLA